MEQEGIIAGWEDSKTGTALFAVRCSFQTDFDHDRFADEYKWTGFQTQSIELRKQQ